jgi:hypothetical protein
LKFVSIFLLWELLLQPVWRVCFSGPPKVLAKPEQQARYGEIGLLECLVESVPAPKDIIWHRDSKALNFSAMERSVCGAEHNVQTVSFVLGFITQV